MSKRALFGTCKTERRQRYTLTDETKHPQVSGGLSMSEGGKSNDYVQRDRYWRTKVDQWQKSNGTVQFEVRNYRYDRLSNRLSMDSIGSVNGSGNGTTTGQAANWDETYAYDGLNRLVDFKRGTYASGSIATPKFGQTWTLDSLGNWRGHSQSNHDTTLLPGVNTFSQTRTVNAANEISATQVNGGGLFGAAYDGAGNQTYIHGAGGSGTYVAAYDGWNRQTGYDANGDGDTFDSGDYRYLYDGLGRRITKFQDTASEGSNAAGSTEEYFYNEGYQLLEVRTGTVAAGPRLPTSIRRSGTCGTGRTSTAQSPSTLGCSRTFAGAVACRWP
jgi:hypothetical protein